MNVFAGVSLSVNGNCVECNYSTTAITFYFYGNGKIIYTILILINVTVQSSN